MLKILIITNLKIEDQNEDKIIANYLRKKNFIVDLKEIDFDPIYDDYYDIFIKRNCYYEERKNLDNMVNIVDKRLKSKNKILINFSGGFDSKGKNYLVELFDKGYKVIPTVNKKEDIEKINQSEYYLLKPLNGYDAMGQIKVKNKDVINTYKDGFIIQPLIDFKSEVQFYFVNKTFIYALSFTPSKVPVYPDANKYDYSEGELDLAKSFANLNKDFVGVQRIDFLKLSDDELLLLEIEDSSPYLDLDMLDHETLDEFLKNYYKMIIHAL